MVNVNFGKFKLVKDELDCTIQLREVDLKITRERYYKLRHLVRYFNFLYSSPYGTSPNGYAYTCGCSHDCCGCLIRRYANIGIHSDGFLIYVISTYNY